MDTDEFTETVRREADLDAEAEAERAVEATLAVLGDRITDGEAEDLAARLPDGPAGTLRDAATDEASSFDPEEFADRVADRLDRDRNEVWPRTRAVGRVLAAALGDREARKVGQQLPDEYGSLFPFASE